MNKYTALHNHLLNLKKDDWKTTFSEIESILGFVLPKSARRYSAWWANNHQNSRHTKAWLDAGWQTSDVDFGTETVMFLRQRKPLRNVKPPSPAIGANNEPYAWDVACLVECRIRMEWKPLGKVTLDQKGHLLFPKADRAPAIYRFRIKHKKNEAVYIGETNNLNRRFGNYRNPGPSQKTSLRINAALIEALGKGSEISLSVVTEGAMIERDNDFEAKDLTSKVVRCLFENAAILNNGGADIDMLNKL